MSTLIPDPATTDWVPLYNLLGSTAPLSLAARAHSTVAQTVSPTNQWIKVNLDTASFDPSGMFSSSQKRFNITQAGTYLASCSLAVSPGSAYADATLIAGLARNGGIVSGSSSSRTDGTGVLRAVCETTFPCVPGDYLEPYGFCNGGWNFATGSPSLFMDVVLMGGPQGPPGTGVPTPVVNGQWIKGVGGAAVWSDLPSRLGDANGYTVTAADLNTVRTAGWYQVRSTTANRPTDWGSVWVTCMGQTDDSCRQVCYQHDSQNVYQRSYAAGVWTAWVQTQWPSDVGWQLFPTPHSNSWANYPGYPPARYRRLPNGMIVLSGLLYQGTNNTIFNYLAAGYRPTDWYRHFGSMGNDAIASVRINTDGGVQLTYPGGGWITLDGVSFFP